MAEKDAPSSFKKSPSPASKPSVHWRQPEAQLVTQLEAEEHVNPEPVQPEGQLESQGNSQVTSVHGSSAAALLSASIGPGERPPWLILERSLSAPPGLRIPTSPLSFQLGLPETKILVERSSSDVFVYTAYPGKPLPGSEKSSEEWSLPQRRRHTDPNPEARSGVPAAIRARASKSAHVLLGEDVSQSSGPQSADKPEGKPQTIPTVYQSREMSEDFKKQKTFITVVKVPPEAPVRVSCIHVYIRSYIN